MAQTRRASGVEENHRRNTLRRAQGMHLAASLFALDEILMEPRVLAPPPIIEPGMKAPPENSVTLTIPYLPTWPELAATYNAPTLSIPEAMSGGSNIAIIGQPGVGKSVALAHIASLAANQHESMKELVPFHMHVADLQLPVKDEKNILNPIIDAISEYAPVFDLTRIPAFVQGVFKGGYALFLVDGFDELTPEGQGVVSEYLKLILKTYPKTRLIITGTPEYLDGLIPIGFVPLSLVTWNQRQMDAFIQRWSELWAQYVALESWAQTGPEVDSLLLNSWINTDNHGLTPLELTLKVWGAYAGDSLGPHVLESIATHIRRVSPNNVPIAALETLAMQIVLNSQPIFDPRAAREWVKSFELPDEKTVDGEQPADENAQAPEESEEDKKAAKQKKKKKKQDAAPAPTSGVLNKLISAGLLVSHPYNQMRFLHPVFGSYLAGHALSAYNADEALLNQSDWTGKNLALRYLASHGDVSGIVQNMLEWSRLPMHRPLLTVSRWLRYAPRNAPWRGKLMGTLANLLQTEGLPLALRGQALAAFMTSGDPAAATLFRQLMSSASPDLVQLAALGSGVMRDVKAIPVLGGLARSSSISSRRAACLALVAIGVTEAMEVVADILLTADEESRRAAAEALANDPGEGYAMLKDGVGMEDIPLRRAIIYGLARVYEPWALELTQKLQVDDQQWIVRNAATEAVEAQTIANTPRIPHPLKPPSETPWLIEFAGKNGTGITPGSPATDVLLLALHTNEAEVRLAALPYLKFTPSEGVIGKIYDAMYADDPEMREYAYQVVWELGTSGIKLPNPTQYGLG